MFARVALEAWARQVLAGLGLPLALAIVLALLNRWTQALLMRALGWNAVVYSTGWLGTPIHELSHYLFGLPFGLRFDEVKLFEPDPDDGVLGYVRYHHDSRWPKFIYVFGQFVSGIAPLFGGAIVLAVVFRLLAPQPDQALFAVERFASAVRAESGPAILDGFVDLTRSTYTAVLGGPLKDARPWVFLYLALAVGTHVAPSKTDLKVAAPGFAWTLAVLLVVDLVLALVGLDPGKLVHLLAVGAANVSALLVFAVVLNLGNLAFAAVVAALHRSRG